MVSKEVAIEIMNRYVEELQTKVDTLPQDERYTLSIIQDKILEFELGWVFFYDSLEFLKSGDPTKRIVGNSPIIIDKRDGSLKVTGTSRSIKFYIDEYISNN